MHRHSLFLFFAPILAIVLVAALLSSVRSAQPPSNVPQATTATANTLALPTDAKPAASPAATARPRPAETTAQDNDLVALVGDESLLLDRFALVQGADAAMSALLKTKQATPAQLLEQMVNHSLVAQQIGAGAAPAVASTARLLALLDSAGKTQIDLNQALADAHIDRPEFDHYFAELLAVEEFARQAATEQGSNVDSYIAALQTQMHISYGPAAAAIRSNSESAALIDPAATSTAAGVTDAISMTDAAATDTGVADTGVVTVTESAERGLAVGQLAPDFSLPQLGQEADHFTFRQLLGTPTVLSFWTTWCPYCLRQTPVLVAEATRRSGDTPQSGGMPQGGDIRFVGIDVAEDAAIVTSYVEQHKIPYSILLDQEGHTAAAYGVEGYPTTYFLDATGQIVAHHIGSLSAEQLAQYVDQLLAPPS